MEPVAIETCRQSHKQDQNNDGVPHMSDQRIHSLLISSMVLAAVFPSANAADQAVSLQSTRAAAISAGALETALEDLRRQTGLQIVYVSALIKGKRTSGAPAGLPISQTLSRMLEGTGLTFQWLDHKTVQVSDSRPIPSTQADEARPSRGNRKGRNEADASQAAPELEELDLKGVPEILVKGARSLNVDIPRTEDDPQPYVVFRGEEIQRSNAPNLEEFFKNRLPMNSVQQLPSQIQANNSSFSSTVNLRGMGSGQTLILLNGRRMPGVPGANFSQPDIKGIALSSIERIEILPSTAGGIYGGGANGGVINIITRTNYAGVDLRATYGNAFDTDVSERRFDMSGGFSIGKRTHLVFSGTHSDANPMTSGDRDFAQRGRDLYNSNVPLANMTAPPPGYTTNICRTATATSTTCTNAPLVLDSGQSLGSNHTFVPVGYARTDNGAALLANAGRYNLDLPNDFNGGRSNLLSNPTVRSATLNLRHEFSARFEGFVDVSHSDTESIRPFPAIVTSAVTLDATAPNNPFDSPIRVSFPAVGLDNTFRNELASTNITTGLIVHLPRNWTAEADYSWSRSRWESTYGNFLVTAGADAAAISGALDVMRDLNAYPLDYSPYLLPAARTGSGPAKGRQTDVTLRASGPVLRIPGGPVTLSAMAERRKETSDASFLYSMSAAAAMSYFWYPERSQTVDSYSLEVRTPLVSAVNALPWVRALDFQASVRRDEYASDAPNPILASVASFQGPFPALSHSTKDTQANRYTLALSYIPVADLTVRASFGTGFLPPSLTQIAPSAPTSVTAPNASGLLDPKRGGTAGSVGAFTSVAGGNLGIAPEDSRSWSTGFILTPRVLPGLRFSLDFTHIEKTNEITSLTAQTLLDLEERYPGRVTRGPLSEADVALGYTGGPVTAMNISAINIAGTQLEAFDFQLDYTLDTARLGQFRWYAIGTNAVYLKRKTSPIAPVDDAVGFTSGLLEWRGNLGLTWSRSAWMVDWNAQYFDDYKVYVSTATPAARATAIQQQGSDTVRSQMYHDLLVSYRFAEAAFKGVLAGTEVSLGIQNVFDESPPILATLATTGGYSTYGDPRLRRYSIALSKRF